MTWLYKQLISKGHLFEKGAKLERLYPLYEAVLTIHFSSTETTKKGAHIRDGLDTKRFMILVVIALIPTTLLCIYNAGLQSLLASGKPTAIVDCIIQGIDYIFTDSVNIICGWGMLGSLFAIIRKHEINEGFW